MQGAVRDVLVKREVAEYLLHLVAATRDHPQLALGVSTRGALGFFRAAQARAFLNGRGYVSPDDLQHLAGPALAHRVQLSTDARYGGESASTLISGVVAKVPIATITRSRRRRRAKSPSWAKAHQPRGRGCGRRMGRRVTIAQHPQDLGAESDSDRAHESCGGLPAGRGTAFQQ